MNCATRAPRRLTTLIGITLAVGAGACATSRPSGQSPATAPTAPAAGAPTASAPAPATQKPAGAAPRPAAGAAATGAKPAPPSTRKTATSKDGTKIAYDVAGSGPYLIALHGGGYSARSWADRGYVDKLKETFTLVTPDQRGIADSGKPTTLEGYALDKMLDDVLAVADAAGAKRFHLWGFGHGATIGRYLAARSDRVISAVLVSADFGPPLSGVVKDAVTGMRAKWLPLVQAQTAGKLDLNAMSASDRTAWDNGVAVSAMALGAMLDYPPLEPAEIKVPTLWLIGAADTSAMENVKAYEGKLAGTKVTLKTISGATYTDTFGKSELTLNDAIAFFKAQSAS
jgi:pimeloyl-ACP methyl ester carboxylesterase